MDSYLIPTGNGASEYVEKRSRFLGLVQPVSSEDEAREIIAACKKSRYQNRYAQPDVSAAFVDHAFQLLPFEENITGKKEKVNSTFPHF